jgi:hypothetical protein
MKSKVMGSIVVLFFALGASQALHAQSPELARTQLLNLIDTLQELGPIGPPGVIDSDRLQRARVQIEQMPPAQLAKIAQAIVPLNFASRLTRAQSTVADYSNSLADKKLGGVTKLVDTAPFPVASGLCTSANGTDVNRIPTGVVLAADVVYFVAEGVKDAASDACNQVAVVLGEGGNGSLACEITDAIYVVAHAVDEGIHFCDDDLTGAVIDANYARLDYINTNLNGVDTDITHGFTSVGTQISNSNAQVAGEFSALDTHISGLIAALSAQLTRDTIPTSGTTCNGIYGGIFPGNLTISRGENCVIVAGGVTGQVLLNGGKLTISNAWVGGSVQVVGGGTFNLGPGLTIAQDLQISSLPSGSGPNRVCGTMVHGTLQSQNNASAVVIGSPSSSPACPGNMVGRDLLVSANSAATTVDGNTVGGNLLDQNNTAATQVFGNVIHNDLQCQNNTSITGGGNTAQLKQGQCATF